MKPQCEFLFNNIRCGLRKGHKHGHVAIDLMHATALSAIQQLMDGQEWSPDTLDSIAEILNQAGFQVGD